MKKNTFIAVISLLVFSVSSFGQTESYWVFLKDKTIENYQIENDFSQKAIERREQQNIPFDASDYPVNSDYLKQIEENVTDLTGNSRWFNAAYIKATEEQIEQLEQFEFITKISKAVVWNESPYCDEKALSDVTYNDQLRISQLRMFYPEYFESKEITGKGVRVAVLDGGFPGVDTHPAFDHLRENNQIIDTYDFVKDDVFAYRGNQHGTMVLSCIAGKYKDNEIMGLAQDAEFLLARTEKSFEPFKEEIFWMEAMEWADQKGADVINSSLGYTFHRYFQENMDGKTSLITKAANKAAEKGILVVNAAGNEGDGDWHYIGAPADADSILSIGGVKPDTHLHINFSSYGPTADGRLKPNVSAAGKALVADKNGFYQVAYGTSFASPLTAGFAACVKQAFPELSVMELKAKIESSGSLYPYFDYAHGYGIPDAGKLFGEKSDKLSVEIIEEKSDIIIHIPDEVFTNSGIHNNNILFYHIQNANGQLDSYKVLEILQQDVARLSKAALKGKKLMVHFNGYTTSSNF